MTAETTAEHWHPRVSRHLEACVRCDQGIPPGERHYARTVHGWAGPVVVAVCRACMESAG